jgi:cell division transport system permease protein
MSTGKLFVRGVLDMRRHPLPQLCTLLTVCMVSFLAGVGLLILHNVQQEVLRSQGQARFQIYWAANANMTSVEQQWADLKKVPGVAEVSTFTPRAALAELMRGLGATLPTTAGNSTASAPVGADDFAWLEGDNPLPATALVSFDIPPGENPEPWMGRMYARLRGMEGVDKVTYNATQLSQATGWIGLIQRAAWPALGFFALVVGLVVGNTMKLMMLARSDEVEILSLVGARPWFIRAPLFANGVVQGFVGGVLSLLCLKMLQSWLRGVLDVPPLFLKAQFLPAWECAALVLATTVVAGLAALLAARR